MGKINWYKRYPDDYLAGVRLLTNEERGAYSTVLEMIYSSADNLADDDKFIAMECRLDVRVWRRIKGHLVELGKLSISGGCLHNTRASTGVADSLARGAAGAHAARTRHGKFAAFSNRTAEQLNLGLRGLAMGLADPLATPLANPLSSNESPHMLDDDSNKNNVLDHAPAHAPRSRTQRLIDSESVITTTLGLSPRETEAPAQVNGTRQALITEAWQPSDEAIRKLRRGRPDLIGKAYDERMQDFREWCSAKAVMSHHFESSWSSFMRKDRFGGARAGGGRPGRSVEEIEASSKAARERSRKFEMED